MQWLEISSFKSIEKHKLWAAGEVRIKLNILQSDIIKKMLGTKEQRMKKAKLCAVSKYVFFATYYWDNQIDALSNERVR